MEKLKTDLEIKGIEVILLIGNHDVPYLTFRPMSYSLMKISDFYRIGEALWMLKPQIAYQLDEYLVSHAGYTEHFQLEEWHLNPVTYDHKADLLLLNQQVSWARGGRYRTGSPIWADFHQELSQFPNPNFSKQIVGHTPVRKIHISESEYLINIDTFSLDSEFNLVGDNSFTFLPSEPMDWC